jgi:ribonuclease BN (tRNA processing enzyme)
MNIRFLGTGTPIGTRGLLQSCILLDTHAARVLLECGMTSMVALHRAQIDPHSIDGVIISHLHGDHFGGLPLLLLDSSMQRRTRPLWVAGPPSTPERVRQALDVFGWSGAWERSRRFLSFRTLLPGTTTDLASMQVTAYSVPHNPATEPTALRIAHAGVTLAYSGDAGWSPALLEVARGADVFICAVWDIDDDDPAFLDYRTLRQHLAEMSAKRILLTHLGPPMLESIPRVLADGFLVAADDLSLELP